MNQAHTVIKKLERISRYIFIGLFTLTVLFAGSYIFLVNKTVLNAVEKEKIEHDIASMNSNLSENEFSYIHSKGGVTMELARELGFVSAADKTIFVTIAKPAGSVAVR